MAMTSTRLLITGVMLLGAIIAGIAASRQWLDRPVETPPAADARMTVQPAVWRVDGARITVLTGGSGAAKSRMPAAQGNTMTLERLGLVPSTRAI